MSAMFHSCNSLTSLDVSNFDTSKVTDMSGMFSGELITPMNIEEIKEPEEIDNKIEELKKQKYTTIVIPNELASFSQDIISKYKYDPTLNIVIVPSKNN